MSHVLYYTIYILIHYELTIVIAKLSWSNNQSQSWKLQMLQFRIERIGIELGLAESMEVFVCLFLTSYSSTLNFVILWNHHNNVFFNMWYVWMFINFQHGSCWFPKYPPQYYKSGGHKHFMTFLITNLSILHCSPEHVEDLIFVLQLTCFAISDMYQEHQQNSHYMQHQTQIKSVIHVNLNLRQWTGRTEC